MSAWNPASGSGGMSTHQALVSPALVRAIFVPYAKEIAMGAMEDVRTIYDSKLVWENVIQNIKHNNCVVQIDGCVACLIELTFCNRKTILELRFLRPDVFIEYHDCEDAGAIFIYTGDMGSSRIDFCCESVKKFDRKGVLKTLRDPEMIGVFVHEYVHLVDMLRWKGENNINHEILGLDPKYNAYNMPDEYNAYWFSGLYEVLCQLPSKITKFQEFIKFVKDKSENMESLDIELEGKYRRKFLRRLHGLYDMLKNSKFFHGGLL